MGLFWEVYQYGLFVFLGLAFFYIRSLKKDGVAVDSGVYKTLAIAFAVIFAFCTMAYISRLNDQIKEEEILQYYIKDCLDKNRNMTYSQCKRDVIDFLRDGELYYDTDSTPEYR